MIKINNLTKLYKNNIVINDLNYVFEEGKTYLLVGANGSGKSTLIKLILSLIKPTNGSIYISEKQIGYIPEKALFPDLICINDFLKNIGLIRKIEEDKINLILDNQLNYWCLDGNKKMDKLSKGMMQKVLIIQSIFHDPKLYIFDEPINGLDFDSQSKFLNIIRNKKNSINTIIIATHFKDYYQHLADKIIYFRDGVFDEESV